jgi:hypothetical protein
MHNNSHIVGCKWDFTWDVFGAYIYLILFCYVVLHVFLGVDTPEDLHWIYRGWMLYCMGCIYHMGCNMFMWDLYGD